MSDIVIRVENLSKKYIINHAAPANGRSSSGDGLRHALQDAVASPFRALRQRFASQDTDNGQPTAGCPSSSSREDFWALKDVSFEVKRGEVLGILGRNGAGKSTLLKMLSRITEPTSGRIGIKGRVASLLEVGTGFHPELTGRENILLNGAILGMTRTEVKEKLDEIVDFSGVERFLDTPVKHFSSGMYVRLAFAVAAHLEPEILIVDEVLAVGDAAFQKKCMSKMESVGNNGRAVLFVSHSLAAISRLCGRAIYLSQGRLEYTGGLAVAAKLYLSEGAGLSAETTWLDLESAPGDDVARLRAVRATNADGRVSERLCINDPIYIEVEYEQMTANITTPLTAAIHLITEGGVVVFASIDFENAEWRATPRRGGRVRTRCKIPANLLAESNYTVLAAVCTYSPDHVHAIKHDAITFQGVEDAARVGAREAYAGDWPGIIRPKLAWEAEYAP